MIFHSYVSLPEGNMVKLLALVGMKAVFKWREIVIFVRTRGCLCCECWTNLKSVHGAKSSSQVLPISEHRSTEINHESDWVCRLDLVAMHGILCVNPADPFQFHGLRRQHQEQVGSLLIVSSYTWPKGFKMSQMGMRRSTTRTKELVMCSFMMSLDLSTSPYFQV